MDDEVARRKDALIMALAERVFVQAQLLTCAAEKLGWDSARVRQLIGELDCLAESGEFPRPAP